MRKWLVTAAALTACGTTAGGGGTSVADVHGDTATDAASAGDVAVGDVSAADADAVDAIALPDLGPSKDISPEVSSDTGTDTGSGGGQTLAWDVSAGDGCVVLATATASASNTCSAGDFMLLSGANVDLESASPGMPVFCPEGSPASAAAIPSDYSACAWTDYLEGMGGLEGTGYIVRDRSGGHHWKMRIDTDQGTAFSASLVAID